MNAKALLLSVAIATVVSACATTTSPTGRTQYVGAVSQAQLNQLGEQAFAEAKAKTPQSRDSRQVAYVGCVVNAIVRQLPSPLDSALLVSAPTSLPACGSVRFIVAGHSPLTILGR